MREFSKRKFRTGIASVALAGMLVFGVSSIALAANQSFSYPLPEFQGNVSVLKGTRQLTNSNAYVKLNSSTDSRAAYFWVDGGSVGNRITESVRLTPGKSSTMPYTNKGQTTVFLRACTDGWQGGSTYVNGICDFKR